MNRLIICIKKHDIKLYIYIYIDSVFWSLAAYMCDHAECKHASMPCVIHASSHQIAKGQGWALLTQHQCGFWGGEWADKKEQRKQNLMKTKRVLLQQIISIR